jgi:hypothetical protein
MTNEERILKYLDNELTVDEKKAFEAELENSKELLEEFNKYLAVKANVEQVKNIKLKPDYLDSILPEFHRKYPTGKRESIRKSLSYAFGVMLLFIISITVLRTFFTDRQTTGTLEEFTQSLNTEQKMELLETLNGESLNYKQVSDTDLVDLLESDLEINNEVLDEYDISYRDILSDMDEDKLNLVYQEILNKNIIEEVTL